MTLPQIQLGLYMMSGAEASKSVHWALLSGYRAIDSAQMYHNEREAGRAITSFLNGSENTLDLKREDIHYTTKLASCSSSYDTVRKSIKKSVEISELEYVDLFLLHSPYGGKEARLTSWKALEDAVSEGEVRMAGVSNFGVRHLSAPTRWESLIADRETRLRSSWLQTREFSPLSTRSRFIPSTLSRASATLVPSMALSSKPMLHSLAQ